MLDTHLVGCPYCGESIEIEVDASAGRQVYIEDCQVCCRPFVVEVTLDLDGDATVTLRHEDE
ncbi:MAG: CPXCG motif-containing cysteine-rich protein [Ectothiorhodospiraceae bacterium]|nr:CPXCG motif-containing cysteine-rich protein [Ectothiorhodospiraceae bacterium]